MEIRTIFMKIGIAFFVIITFLFLIFSSNILSDYDNPLVDQVPYEVIDQTTPTISPLPTVVTVDGYDNFDMGVDFAEGHISTNPTNPLAFFTAFNINGTHYSASGHVWTTNNPNFGATMRGDPVTAYDSLGRLYYENMYGSPNILGTKIVRSDNNSLSWFPAVNGNTGGDKNWLAADQTAGPYTNYVYGTMTNTSFSGVNFIRSTIRGVSFTNTASFTFSPLPGSMPCVGPKGSTSGGAVYVVINSCSTFASTYIFQVCLNVGISLQLNSPQHWAGYVGSDINTRNAVNNMRTRPDPFIAVDIIYGHHRGRV